MFLGILTYITKKIINVYKIFSSGWWGGAVAPPVPSTTELNGSKLNWSKLNVKYLLKLTEYYPTLFRKNILIKIVNTTKLKWSKLNLKFFVKLPGAYPSLFRKLCKVKLPPFPKKAIELIRDNGHLSLEHMFSLLNRHKNKYPNKMIPVGLTQYWVENKLKNMRGCLKKGDFIKYNILCAEMVKHSREYSQIFNILKKFLKSQELVLVHQERVIDLNIGLQKLDGVADVVDFKKFKWMDGVFWHLEKVCFNFSKKLDKKIELKKNVLVDLFTKEPGTGKYNKNFVEYVENLECLDKLVWKPTMLDSFEKIMESNHEALLDKEPNLALWKQVVALDTLVSKKYSISDISDISSIFDRMENPGFWTLKEIADFKKLYKISKGESLELLKGIEPYLYKDLCRVDREEYEIVELEPLNIKGIEPYLYKDLCRVDREEYEIVELERLELSSLEEKGVIEAICLYVLENFPWI